MFESGRSTCRACRREDWLVRYADEIELLVVTKGYTVARARDYLSRSTHPLCYNCGKPIKGGSHKSLFCKLDKRCHSMYNRYRRLVRSGMTEIQALREVLQ
jgi:hypothetical protein